MNKQIKCESILVADHWLNPRLFTYEFSSLCQFILDVFQLLCGLCYQCLRICFRMSIYCYLLFIIVKWWFVSMTRFILAIQITKNKFGGTMIHDHFEFDSNPQTMLILQVTYVTQFESMRHNDIKISIIHLCFDVL